MSAPANKKQKNGTGKATAAPASSSSSQKPSKSQDKPTKPAPQTNKTPKPAAAAAASSADSKGAKGKKRAAEEVKEEEEEEEDEEGGVSDETLDKLEEVSKELGEFDKEFEKEVRSLQRKYHAKKLSSLQKRDGIVAEIPEFWRIIFSSHPIIREALVDFDHEVLEGLKSINVSYFDDYSTVSTASAEEKKKYKNIPGYTIALHFDPEITKAFFPHQTLYKTYLEIAPPKKQQEKKGKGKKEDDEEEDSDEEEEEETIVLSPAKIKWTGKYQKTMENENADSFFVKWFSTEESSDSLHREVSRLLKEELYENPLEAYQSALEPEGFDEDSEEEEEDDEEDAQKLKAVLKSLKGKKADDDDDDDDDDEEAPQLV